MLSEDARRDLEHKLDAPFDPTPEELHEERGTLREKANDIFQRPGKKENTAKGWRKRLELQDRLGTNTGIIMIKCTREAAIERQVKLWHILGRARKRGRCSREDGRGGASSEVLQENLAGEDDAPLATPRSAGHRALLVFAAEARKTKGKTLCSTRNLQLLCIELCAVVRDWPCWHLTVGRGALASTKLCKENTRGGGQPQEDMKPSRPHTSRTPSRVATEPAEAAPQTRRPDKATSRVPPLLGKSVVWSLSVDEMRNCEHGLSRVTSLELGTDEYPSGDNGFNEALDGIAWPSTLETLKFGGDFDQSLEGITWPSSLTKMTFGFSFGRSITAATWPDHLQHLSFKGGWFNKPLAGVAWPKSLTHLSFGIAFDQSIDGRVFPDSLEHLSFGKFFNRSISETVWPASLLRLRFGSSFNQPVFGIVWPGKLKELSFGKLFRQDLRGVVWPRGLDTLGLGWFGGSFDEISWPMSMTNLCIRGNVNIPIGHEVFPDSLQQLSLGNWFDKPITNIDWPASLLRLAFGKQFNQPVVGTRWPTRLQELSFGAAFNWELSGVVWPTGLQSLHLGGYDKSVAGISWPDSLRKVHFQSGFSEDLTRVKWPTSANVWRGLDLLAIER